MATARNSNSGHSDLPSGPEVSEPPSSGRGAARRFAPIAPRLLLLALAVLPAACTDDVRVVPPDVNGLGGAGVAVEDPSGESPEPDAAEPVTGVMTGRNDMVAVETPPLQASGGSPGTTPTEEPVDPTAPWPTPPSLRSAVSLADAELARQALTLMGSSDVGATGSCHDCHSLGRPTLTNWSRLSQQFTEACLDDPALTDRASVDAMLSCFHGASGQTKLAPANFGIYAAAAHLPWFRFVFEQASGPVGAGTAAHEQFVTRVGMPRSGERWTQPQFDLVAEWFARGLPGLSELVPADVGEAVCTPGLAPGLAAQLATLKLTGWRAKNAEVPLLMFGCGAGQAGVSCLSDLALASGQPYGSGWDIAPGTRIRILYDNSATPSTYWSRSSPDGRYIGSGLIRTAEGALGGQIVDLQRRVAIPANFSYDASFFPDNSGFVLQQGGGYSSTSGDAPSDGSVDVGSATLVCEASVLASAPTTIAGNEAACVSLDSKIGLYQQLAKSIDGDDYWALYGSYTGDDGGFSPVLANPSAAFDAQSAATFVLMLNQGNAFEAAAPSKVALPRQGDPVLSPSGRLLVTRVKGQEYTTTVNGSAVVAAEQTGYALYAVSTSTDGATPSASLEDMGRLCLTGGKAVFSYDERWLVLHHYVTPDDARELGFTGPDDPGFAEYAALGASNLYLVDLTTGTSQRISNVSPGQYALFPHFRSDGWIYFVVRTLAGNEYFAASDAALVAEGAPSSASQ
jgi:hypothetical protein